MNEVSARPSILVVSPWGTSGVYSGPVVLQQRLFSEVSDLVHAHIVLLCRLRPGGTRTQSWANETVVISRGSKLGIVTQILWTARASWFVLRAAKGYEVVHFQGAYWLNLVASLAVRSHSKVIFLPVLENGDLRQRPGVLGIARRKLQKLALRRAHRVFALSAGIETEILNSGIAQSRVVRISNPVSPDFATQRGHRRSGAFSVLFSGKLGPTKRPDKLLNALTELVATGIDARATFIGPFVDPEYEQEFNFLVEALELGDRVQVLGFVREPSVVLKRTFHVFVLPSTSEGMPGAMAEAMYSSLPVIVTDVGAMGAVARESGAGIVIERAEELGQALIKLANDEDLRSQMADRAAAFARLNFSQRAVAETYLSGLHGVPFSKPASKDRK